MGGNSENKKPVFPTTYVYSGQINTGQKQSEDGMKWFVEFCKENNINVDSIVNGYVFPIQSCPDKKDSDGDGRYDGNDPYPVKENVFYDRTKVRQYAKKWCYNTEDTDDYAYLDIMSDVSDCANFVSQCIYAGGYPMTDEWYMYKYPSNTSDLEKTIKSFSSGISKAPVKISEEIQKKIFKKVVFPEVIIKPQYCENVMIILDYANPYNQNGKYIWSNSWTSIAWQIPLGQRYFFSDSDILKIRAVNGSSKDNISNVMNYVKKYNIQVGDVMYLGVDNPGHAMIITNITDEGKLCVSGHEKARDEMLMDEEYWKAGGFADITICKVNDVIK